MRRKFYELFCLLAVCLLMVGCATIGMDISISKDGTGSIHILTKLDKEGYTDYLRTIYTDVGMESDAGDMVNSLVEQGIYTEEVIEGRTYLVMDSSEGNTDFESVPAFYSQIGLNSGYELTETSFCISAEAFSEENIQKNGNDYYDEFANMSQEDLEKYMSNSYLEISVTFDYPIKETNGTIDPENSRKASWKLALTSDIDRIFAYCDSSISFSGVRQGSTSQQPVTLHFDGAESAVLENGQVVENDTIFSVDGTYCITLKNSQEQKTVYFAIDRTAPELLDESGNAVSIKNYEKVEKIIYLLDNGGIAAADLDGKSVLECNLMDNEEFIYYIVYSPSTLSDGKHTLVISDTYGNKETVTFKTDKTAPIVKGVKNKENYKKAVTIKFSDDVSGIKKAVLNGKSIKSGKKIKDAGNYTLKVRDKAGNITTVKFNIKKKTKKK